MYNINLGYPSIYAHILSGTLVFTVLIFVFWNIGKLQNIDLYRKLVIMLLISISIGIHGLSHFELEHKVRKCKNNLKRVRFVV